jgi:hypothetical protein
LQSGFPERKFFSGPNVVALMPTYAVRLKSLEPEPSGPGINNNAAPATISRLYNNADLSDVEAVLRAGSGFS